ncbi:MAG TPA: hypothetical protein VFI41_04910 [Gemmatimonadales bacterium]|nr:hypothetical protein [Gemmatimonadales bacterium]
MNRALSRHQFKVQWAKNKDTLKEGELAAGHSYLTVLARDPDEGKLIAEQMVAARGHEPTKADWIP